MRRKARSTLGETSTPTTETSFSRYIKQRARHKLHLEALNLWLGYVPQEEIVAHVLDCDVCSIEDDIEGPRLYPCPELAAKRDLADRARYGRGEIEPGPPNPLMDAINRTLQEDYLPALRQQIERDAFVFDRIERGRGQQANRTPDTEERVIRFIENRFPEEDDDRG